MWDALRVEEILARIYMSFGENHRKDRQARPEIEPGTSRLPVLKAELLSYWWDTE